MGQRWLVDVQAGGNTIRTERLLRDLRGTLDEIADVRTEFASQETTGNGQKGGFGDLQLWVDIAGVAVPVVIAAIQEWCRKDRHRTVELTYDGVSITLPGDPSEAQERIIRRIVDEALGDQTSPAPDEIP